MLDHLTKGRIEIGTGRGVSPYELAFYNVDSREAPAIYKESVEVLIAALTQDTVDYHGKYFDYKNVPIELKPLQQPHPPLWYGTASAETAALPAWAKASCIRSAEIPASTPASTAAPRKVESAAPRSPAAA